MANRSKGTQLDHHPHRSTGFNSGFNSGFGIKNGDGSATAGWLEVSPTSSTLIGNLVVF
jgi:hypothetical protein